MMTAAVLNRHFTCIALVVLVFAPGTTLAQPPAADEADRAPRVGAVEEADPTIYYLRSASGELVAVPNLSLEEWQDLRLLKQGLRPRNPEPNRFSFVDDVELSGAVVGERLEFDVMFRVHLADREAEDTGGWVRIPLGMNQAKLVPNSEHVGLGKLLVTYERNGEGYVAWLQATPSSDHTFKLKMKAALVRRGGETRFVLSTPTTPSRFRLDVPGQQLEVSSNHEGENILDLQQLESGRTRIQIENVGGHLELSWRKQRETTLEASGDVRVTINGQQIESEAMLKVRTLGGPVKSVDVRLPAGMKLIAESQSGIDKSVIETDASNCQIVRATRTDGKASTSFDLRLKAWTPPDAPRPSKPFDIGGFEVRGGLRQQGAIRLAIKGDRTVDWSPGAYVRQVAIAPEGSRQDDVAARFEYYHQPYSLEVTVAAKQSRVNIEPTYLLLVDQDQLRLEATLRYQISGSRIQEVEVDLTGWDIDQLLPAENLADEISLDSLSPLKIRLSKETQSPSSGEFEIRILGHQPIAADATSVSVELPRARGNAASPAKVFVQPANNVDLDVSPEGIQGLVSETPASVDSEVPALQQERLVFREEPSGTASVFAAGFQVREGSISVAVRNELSFSPAAVAVEQRFLFVINFVAVDELVFELPARLAELDSVLFSTGEQPLTITNVSQSIAESDDEGMRANVDLLEERIGSFEMTTRYTIPLDELQAGGPSSVVVPLVQPMASETVRVTENTLLIASDQQVDVELVDDVWQLVDAADALPALAGEKQYQTEQSVKQVDCAATLVQLPRQTSTRLSRMWVQTWMTATVRQDRACLQVTTNEERIRLGLPEGAELIALARDGQRLDSTPTANGLLTVDLGNSSEARDYTLEVWYSFAPPTTPLGQTRVDPPRIPGVERADRAYWQLVLPATEHLLFNSAALTPEYTWQWNTSHLGRRANRQQRDLETLVHASNQDDLPAVTNRYLFSSVGALEPVRFITASRMLIMLVFSGFVLIVGLLIIYFRSLRHPASLLVGGVAILAVGFVLPEPAILAAQAASLGMVLVLLARLLRWNVARRKPLRPGFQGSTMITSDSRHEELSISVVEGSSRASTAVSPGNFNLPTVEPKP